MEYTQRLDVFEPKTILKVVEGGLVWPDSKVNFKSISVAKIRNVRLK